MPNPRGGGPQHIGKAMAKAAEETGRAMDELAKHLPEIEQYLDQDGESLYGRCSHCERTVNNHDPDHRVTSIIDGGRGVECARRGDIPYDDAQPLAVTADIEEGS